MELAPVLIGYSEELYHQGDVHISGDARRRHLGIFGATGAGKSTLLRNMIASDIKAGHALMAQPRPVSILELAELLTNADYRAEALANVGDPVVLRFFRREFDRWTPSLREEAIAPVLNRADAFTTDPLIQPLPKIMPILDRESPGQ